MEHMSIRVHFLRAEFFSFCEQLLIVHYKDYI